MLVFKQCSSMAVQALYPQRLVPHLGAAARGVLQAQAGCVHQLQVSTPHEGGLVAGEQHKPCALALSWGEGGHEPGAWVQAPAPCGSLFNELERVL